MPDKILILGGTAEAARAARRLVGEGAQVITALAGRLAARPSLPGAVRIGGFGGAEGLRAYLAAEGINRVIDATHPFATVISRHAAAATQALGIPLEVLSRPAWTKHPGDRWHWAEDAGMAARMGPRLGRRIFLTTGAQTLSAFTSVGGPFYLVRLIEDPGGLAFPRSAILLGRGPFTVAGEIALMENFAIDLLVTKASGGVATEAKIIAARRLGIRCC